MAPRTKEQQIAYNTKRRQENAAKKVVISTGVLVDAPKALHQKEGKEFDAAFYGKHGMLPQDALARVKPDETREASREKLAGKVAKDIDHATPGKVANKARVAKATNKPVRNAVAKAKARAKASLKSFNEKHPKVAATFKDKPKGPKNMLIAAMAKKAKAKPTKAMREAAKAKADNRRAKLMVLHGATPTSGRATTEEAKAFEARIAARETVAPVHTMPLSYVRNGAPGGGMQRGKNFQATVTFTPAQFDELRDRALFNNRSLAEQIRWCCSQVK